LAAIWLVALPGSADAYDPDGLRLGVARDALFGVEPVNSDGHLELTTGLWFSAAGATLRKQSSVGEIDLAGTSVRGAVTAGLSLFERARLGFVLPLVFHQTGESLDGAPIDGSGLADPRIIGHVALTKNRGPGLNLGGTLETTLPLGDEGAWTGDGAAGVALHLETEYLNGPLAAVSRAGYRIRTSQRVFDLDVGDAIELAAGLRYDVKPKVRLQALLSSSTLASDPFAGGATPVELVVGVQHTFHHCYAVTLGGGGPINAGVGAAAWRGLVGVSHHCPSDGAQRPQGETAAERRERIRARKATASGSDQDGDGVTDDRDWCPTEPEDKDQHQDEDGCPEPDNDGDGVEDADDACPSTPEDLDRFEDGDGCPDLDNDRDGVPDLQDACPDAPETVDGIDDEDGCPEAANNTDFQVAAGYVMPPTPIAFESGTSTMTTETQTSMAPLAQYLIRRTELVLVEIQGHTHSEGADDANMALSSARAQAVADRLTALGVAPARLRATGFGETMPMESNATAAGRRANERVDLRIVKGPGSGGAL